MAKFETNAVRYMVDLIRDFGLTDFQAAGIVGNAGHESGGFEKLQELNPTAGRGGYGDFQWTGPRRVAFETWLARNFHKGWTVDVYDANYSMLFRELVGPEAASLTAVKATTSLEDATKVFMDKFERPGVPHLESRVTWAKKAREAFAASGIDPNVIRPTVEAVVVQGPSPLVPIIDFVQAHPEIIQLILGLFTRPGQAVVQPPTFPSTSTPSGEPVFVEDKFAVQLKTAAAVLVPIAITALSATGIWGKLASGLISVFMTSRKP